ncbi:MAG: hypothetical protein QF415_06070 [Candidatus Undinarchaeales archaeon]|jgi:hypothetical protein|nr:hypothetical protein [Candidatus Undinarchaeales archaeon]MDP7492469.1 hypothetical protein [Candidatus Undinarchaeales archaeon]
MTSGKANGAVVKHGGRSIMFLFLIAVTLIFAVFIIRELAIQDIAGGKGLSMAVEPFTILIVVIVFGMLGELKKVELNIGREGGQ